MNLKHPLMFTQSMKNENIRNNKEKQRYIKASYDK